MRGHGHPLETVAKVGLIDSEAADPEVQDLEVRILHLHESRPGVRVVHLAPVHERVSERCDPDYARWGDGRVLTGAAYGERVHLVVDVVPVVGCIPPTQHRVKLDVVRAGQIQQRAHPGGLLSVNVCCTSRWSR
jgi:hypothetical protein